MWWRLKKRVLLADLIELIVLDFDIIVEMDWLPEGHMTIDCYEECILLLRREKKRIHIVI